MPFQLRKFYEPSLEYIFQISAFRLQNLLLNIQKYLTQIWLHLQWGIYNSGVPLGFKCVCFNDRYTVNLHLDRVPWHSGAEGGVQLGELHPAGCARLKGPTPQSLPSISSYSHCCPSPGLAS